MGSLAEKRCKFTVAKIDLELYMLSRGKTLGYHFAIGRAKLPTGTPGVHKHSTHFSGLAVHYIIYDLNFNWMHDVDPEREERIYKEAHTFWESRGGARSIKNDLNHFSFEHQGII